MLAFADQFPEWKEFPKGLHVMLVDQDLNVINDLKCKLDSCGYSVTCYTKGEEALQALEDKKKIFHVVVVDATRNDTFDGFMVVAAAKHLTTIMMASPENMNIMMQGIAAGASEFLQKPLSEERLKNIWQHVVRKALGLGHLVPQAALSPLAIDHKLNTTPKPKVGNSASDGCQDTTQMNQEDGNSRDESSATHELFFHDEHHIHSNSSFMGVDGKDDFDTFLCSTPPQLEHSCTRIVPTDHDDMEFMGSPSMSASREFDMKTDLKEMHDYFDDCDNYFHIKSEVDMAVNNSVVLNELFDSKSQIDSENFLLISDDDQSVGNEGFVDTKTCNDLQLNDRPDNLDDITIGGGFLDETMDQNLSMRLDCLDDEELQQAGEEALLTAVVKVEEKSARNPQCSVGPSTVNTCNDNGKNMHRLSSTGNVACPNSERRFSETQEEMKCRSDSEQNCCTKGRKSSNGKKKMKVDWTPELHRQFVQAVEQLGVDKAIPSRILELMGVKCLTRHNIASHLQKYRSHRKHSQAREAEAVTWNQRSCPTQAAGVAAHDRPGPPLLRPQLPSRLAARPPAATTSHTIQMRAAFSVPSTPVLHVWGHPTADPSLHFWPAWPPPGCQLDAWGNPFYPAQPILRVPLTTTPSVAVANLSWRPSAGKSPSFHPPKEMVISAINEVLQNPYVPLPLGLKSPSLESVVCELQRQGISMASTPNS